MALGDRGLPVAGGCIDADRPKLAEAAGEIELGGVPRWSMRSCGRVATAGVVGGGGEGTRAGAGGTDSLSNSLVSSKAGELMDLSWVNRAICNSCSILLD